MTDTKHSLAGAIVILVASPLLAIGLYAMAEDARAGKELTVKSRVTGRTKASKQWMADLLNGVAGALGPHGAIVVGSLGVLAAAGYLGYVVKLRRRGEMQGTAVASGSMASGFTGRPSSEAGSATCRSCGTLLTRSERTGAGCPSCGSRLR